MLEVAKDGARAPGWDGRNLRITDRDLGSLVTSGFGREKLLAPGCDTKNRLLQVGVEEVRRLQAGTKVSRWLLARTEENQRLERDETRRLQADNWEYRLFRIVRDGDQRLQTEMEGDWQAGTEEARLLQVVRNRACRFQAGMEGNLGFQRQRDLGGSSRQDEESSVASCFDRG